MKRSLLIKIFPVLLTVLLFCGGCGKVEDADLPDSVQEENMPTPPAGGSGTFPPEAKVNGVVYRVASYHCEVELDEDDCIGTIEKQLTAYFSPPSDYSSNCLPAGTLIYKDADDDTILHFKYYDEESETYRYSYGEKKY